MDNKNFDNWCQRATALIRYGPDREAVAQELQAHLEDHYEMLIDQGLSPEEAEKKALDAMGDAKEIAPQLESIHKPWLGYLYSAVRFVAVAIAIWALFRWATIGGSMVSDMIGAHSFESLPANFGELDYYSKPNVADRSDGYHFQITEAGYSEDESLFFFEFRIMHWPWLKRADVSNHFWAVDSLGNYYGSRNDTYPGVTPHGWSSSGCLASHYMIIQEFDCDADWVELHYDRDGRDVVLRIDLTGGDSQ